MVSRIDGPSDEEMTVLRAALEKIATAPEGVYSRDKETYLKNVIEWCQETARVAITQAALANHAGCPNDGPCLTNPSVDHTTAF